MVSKKLSKITNYKQVKMYKFIKVLLITILSVAIFPSCGDKDEPESEWHFQTGADKELEKELMNTTWKLVKVIYYDSMDNIKEERSYNSLFHLTSKKASDDYNEYSYLCIEETPSGEYEDTWSVYADGIIFITLYNGKIISYTGNKLVVSNHKQDIFGYSQNEGATMYFEKVGKYTGGDEDDNDVEQGSSSKYAKWENGVLKNGTNSQPYLGSWLETYYLDYEGDRWVKNTLYVFNDDNSYELHKRYVGTENEYKVSKGTYRVSGDKLYLTEENKTEKSYKLSDVSRERLTISGDHYYPTTLTTLYDNATIDIREIPVSNRLYFDDKVYCNIVIAPKWGVDHYIYSVDNGEEINVSGKRGVDKKFKNFDFGTTHTYKIKAYNKKGEQFSTVTGEFTVPGSQGTINYFTYNGTVYPISKVEMQTSHATSSSGANFKYLRMFSSDDTFLQFQYATHSWDGIDKMWYDNTKCKPGGGALCLS